VTTASWARVRRARGSRTPEPRSIHGDHRHRWQAANAARSVFRPGPHADASMELQSSSTRDQSVGRHGKVDQSAPLNGDSAALGEMLRFVAVIW
jgi:hypothetical protein